MFIRPSERDRLEKLGSLYERAFVEMAVPLIAVTIDGEEEFWVVYSQPSYFYRVQ